MKKTVLFLILFLNGCVSYNVVGKFDNYDEVFLGDVDHNLLIGVGDIKAKAEKSGIICEGQSSVTYIPPFSLGCKGQRGIAPLLCSDGRTINVNWIATSCTTGYGTGNDQDNTTFSFTFGHPREEALKIISTLKKQVAGKQPLPVYNPKKVREEKGFATGTAFAVSANGDLITNYHVIEDAEKITVVDTFTQKEWAANVKVTDKENDIALININANLEPLNIIDTLSIQKGEEVLTLGYPLIMIQGQEQKASFGRINSLKGIKDDDHFFQIDIPIQPGNSGGPLINKNGDVIGIVSMTLNEFTTLRLAGKIPQNVNYAVKSDYALPLINIENQKKYKLDNFKDVISKKEKSVFLVITRNK